MYSPYLLSFKLLHATGLKKTSVRLARHMEKCCRQPLENSKLYDAVWMFFTFGQSFPLCRTSNGYGSCFMPVLSDDDPFHEYCRQAQAKEAARLEAEENAYLDSRCKQHGCWEDAVKDGYCQSDWDYNFRCTRCGGNRLECGDCDNVDPEEANDVPVDEDDSVYDDEIDPEDLAEIEHGRAHEMYNS